MSKLREMREKILSKKDNKGFTLVELIVVIVILAILVGVTIGGVYGYVNKSRVNTDVNNASAITSTLSTMTTRKDLSGSTFAGKKAIITWSTSQKLNADSSAFVDASGTTANDATPAFDTGIDSKLINSPIAELLPDGLPTAKTAGAKFALVMAWDDKGNFTTVSCKAYDDAATITVTPGEAEKPDGTPAVPAKIEVTGGSELKGQE